MTNYNERLDKLLANLVNQVAANEQRLLNGNATREETIDSDSNATMRAEQAITSLIKELVADAKPGRADTQIWRENPDDAWDMAIDQFEQNLLIALEEK